MNAYKCDICGDLYEKNAYLVVEVDQQKKKCTLKFMSCDSEKFASCNSDVDICPNCLKALQKTISERKNRPIVEAACTNY